MTVSHIHRLIAHQGPLTVAQFMAAALTDPRHGYYTKARDENDPFGRAGDFVTAPEVSQVFGELIGLWCADFWLRMGSPPGIALVELGPGRGTLMADLLRATAIVPGFHDAIQVHLVEASHALRDRQQAALAPFMGRVICQWHAELGGIPDCAMLLVANEFFDALPIHQFVATPDGWRERMVAIDPATDRLQFVVARAPTPALALLTDRPCEAPLGTTCEISPAAIAVIDSIAGRLSANGGAALIIDYGGNGTGDSLQGVRAHREVDVFDDPGEVDLSAHVDFPGLAAVGAERGAVLHGPQTQGRFLMALGAERRLGRLMAAAPARTADLRQAVDRLIAPDQMGDRFKVLAVTGPGQPVPDGFQAPVEAVT